MTKGRDMAMGGERSKALHNFTMPCDLRWGNQRHLRCMRVISDAENSPMRRKIQGSSSSSYPYNHPIQQRRMGRDSEFVGEFLHGSPAVGPTSRLKRGGGGGDGDEDEDEIAAMRKKVMFDLQTAAEKMKDAFWRDGGLDDERDYFTSRHPPPPQPPQPSPPPPPSDRPWNLRTRRAACRMPIATARNTGSSAATAGISLHGTSGKALRFDTPRPKSDSSQIHSTSPAAPAATTPKPTVHRIDGGTPKERPKFSLPLLKREIEEDFFSMVGHRPPRRPKKRTRTVQKDLDTLFPGVWLTEITADLYRVADAAP